jgi:hypothetical protein
MFTLFRMAADYFGAGESPSGSVCVLIMSPLKNGLAGSAPSAADYFP